MSLKACAEVSVWTDFCENKLKHLMSETASTEDVRDGFENLEKYLARPAVTPSLNKRKVRNSQQHAGGKMLKRGKQSIDEQFKRELKESLEEFSAVSTNEHAYLEGRDLTVVDLIVFPCVTLLWVNVTVYLLKIALI